MRPGLQNSHSIVAPLRGTAKLWEAKMREKGKGGRRKKNEKREKRKKGEKRRKKKRGGKEKGGGRGICELHFFHSFLI